MVITSSPGFSSEWNVTERPAAAPVTMMICAWVKGTPLSFSIYAAILARASSKPALDIYL